MSLTAIYGYKWKLELFNSKTYNGQDNAIRDKEKKKHKVSTKSNCNSPTAIILSLLPFFLAMPINISKVLRPCTADSCEISQEA